MNNRLNATPTKNVKPDDVADTQLACPLCSSEDTGFYHRDKHRCYFLCSHCQLVFVNPTDYLSVNQERQEYDLHDNQIDDQGYRRFLNRVYQPLVEQLSPESRGLDFGCGPGPALAAMLEEGGHQVALYDVFYHPDSTPLQAQQYYDFITATEVVEHLHQPYNELLRLWQLLKPSGLLAIMTKRVTTQAAFSTWHYKNDLTHVCFFSEFTFEWLAQQLSASLQWHGADVVIMKK